MSGARDQKQKKEKKNFTRRSISAISNMTFDEISQTERGWSSNGDEESSEEARKERGQEEVRPLTREATATSPPRIPLLILS